MFNATVTISRSGVTYDQTTGLRTEGTDVVILRDQQCLFSPERNVRSRNSDGMIQYVRQNPSVHLESDVEIPVGSAAVVTYREQETTFAVSEATCVEGVLTTDWRLTLDRIAT